MHFLDPTNDYAFKRVFGNENKKEILISFLNSVLGREGAETIEDVTLLNPHQAPQLKDAKATILDVRCHDQRGHEYIVEMQVLKQEYFDKRVLYYCSKAYHSQLETGQHYRELHPVIFLGILNFEFTDNEHWISTHRIYDLETRQHILTDFDFTFVELPKFVKSEQELETVADKWLYFLKHAQDLEAVPAVIYENALKEAFEVVNRYGWTSEQLDLYEQRKMAVMDEAARVSQGVKEGIQQGVKLGIEKGLQQGREEGLERGLQRGREEGRQAANLEHARQLHELGVPENVIKKVTTVDLSQLVKKEL